MSTAPEVQDNHDRQLWIELLTEAAVLCRPRMFAIHGVRHGDDHQPVLGWGLEFPDGDGAIFTDPVDRSVHQADTAERVLRVLSVIGDVRLTWLDDD